VITALSIKNFALIDDVQVAFGDGLTSITGETGAGKSIMLGALALILGKRADIGSVKNPEKKCVIEGQFSIGPYKLQELFEEHDLDYEPTTILRREILPGGKSRAFVNDTPVTLNQLQAIAPFLVDIHSQHETLSLFSESFQIEVIDALAGNAELLQKYSDQLREFKTVDLQIKSLRAKKEAAAKELDYNTFLHTELEQANLKGLDQAELEECYQTLNNAEEIQESLAAIRAQFSEEQRGTLETAKQARSLLNKLKSFATHYDQLWERLNSVIIELEDIDDTVADLLDRVEADPQRLFETNEKLQTLYKLQQKHGVDSIEELVALQEELASKIDDTHTIDNTLSELEGQLVKSKNEAVRLAKELHDKRVAAIPKLKKQLETYLKELGLPNARFNFEFSTANAFKHNGMDDLQLLFTANKGMAFGSLKKVASGGELSRIMLSIKAVLAQYKKLPTLIFDEIDTGVSGEVANQMAHILSEMGHSMQVMSITHLPQIASRGKQHIKVYKEDFENRTQTKLRLLDPEERVVEIAQMIGGKNITEAALANAKELLN
jgi:DNA repair protein RecN (Recombination protein N)